MTRKSLTNVVLVLFNGGKYEFFFDVEGVEADIKDGIFDACDIKEALLIDIKGVLRIEHIVKANVRKTENKHEADTLIDRLFRLKHK